MKINPIISKLKKRKIPSAVASRKFGPISQEGKNARVLEGRKEEKINLEEFISIKGWRALGNKLSNKKVKQINRKNLKEKT